MIQELPFGESVKITSPEIFSEVNGTVEIEGLRQATTSPPIEYRPERA